MLVLAYFGFYRQMLDLTWVYDKFVPLLSAATLFSFALSAVLYTASLRKGTLCAKGGCTGVLHGAYSLLKMSEASVPITPCLTEYVHCCMHEYR